MKLYLVELYIYDSGEMRLIHQKTVYAQTDADAIIKAREMWPNYGEYRVARLSETLETK